MNAVRIALLALSVLAIQTASAQAVEKTAFARAAARSQVEPEPQPSVEYRVELLIFTKWDAVAVLPMYEGTDRATAVLYVEAGEEMVSEFFSSPYAWLHSWLGNNYGMTIDDVLFCHIHVEAVDLD